MKYYIVILFSVVIAILAAQIRAETMTADDTSLASSVTTSTSSETEKQAYCQYVQDTAEAEDRLDTGINTSGRAGKSDTNSGNNEISIAVSKSLSKHLQGNSALRIAKLQCQLYSQNLDLQNVVKYKMPLIDQMVAKQQVIELENILHLLDDQTAAAEKRKGTGNATIADVMTFMQQRSQIYDQYSAAKISAVIPHLPDIPKIDVEKSMHEVNVLTRTLQEELNHKQALQAWDIAFIAGMQRAFAGEVGTFSTEAPPLTGQSIPYNINTRTSTFAFLSFSYNINMEPYKHKLAASVTSLMKLQQQQNDGLTRQVQFLQKSISDSLDIQKNSLGQIDQQIDYFNTDLKRLQGLQSIEAFQMRSQISINLAIATMEDHLTRLRIKLLSSK
jgi:hypothetical protein